MTEYYAMEEMDENPTVTQACRLSFTGKVHRHCKMQWGKNILRAPSNRCVSSALIHWVKIQYFQITLDYSEQINVNDHLLQSGWGKHKSLQMPWFSWFHNNILKSANNLWMYSNSIKSCIQWKIWWQIFGHSPFLQLHRLSQSTAAENSSCEI